MIAKLTDYYSNLVNYLKKSRSSGKSLDCGRQEGLGSEGALVGVSTGVLPFSLC